MSTHNLWLIIIEGGALKETEEAWDALYILYGYVEFHSDLCLILSSCNVLISGTLGSNEKVVPNKDAYSLDWETGKVWASLSINSLWIVEICTGQVFLVLTL
jgi:hypothetical protein